MEEWGLRDLGDRDLWGRLPQPCVGVCTQAKFKMFTPPPPVCFWDLCRIADLFIIRNTQDATLIQSNIHLFVSKKVVFQYIVLECSYYVVTCIHIAHYNRARLCWVQYSGHLYIIRYKSRIVYVAGFLGYIIELNTSQHNKHTKHTNTDQQPDNNKPGFYLYLIGLSIPIY